MRSSKLALRDLISSDQMECDDESNSEEMQDVDDAFNRAITDGFKSVYMRQIKPGGIKARAFSLPVS